MLFIKSKCKKKTIYYKYVLTLDLHYPEFGPSVLGQQIKEATCGAPTTLTYKRQLNEDNCNKTTLKCMNDNIPKIRQSLQIRTTILRKTAL